MAERAPEGPHERTVGRWYSVTRDGLACLCLDEANAREMAAQCDRDYPKHAPHRAMQLVDAGELDRLRSDKANADAAYASVCVALMDAGEATFGHAADAVKAIAADRDRLRAERDALRTALERCYDAAQDGPRLTVGEQHKIVQMLQPNA